MKNNNNGIKYCCGTDAYSVSGHVEETTGKWLVNDVEIFTNMPEKVIIQAGKALLDYYFYNK